MRVGEEWKRRDAETKKSKKGEKMRGGKIRGGEEGDETVRRAQERRGDKVRQRVKERRGRRGKAEKR